MKTIFTIVLTAGIMMSDQLMAQFPTSENTALLNEHQRYWHEHKNYLKLEKNSIEVSTKEIPAKLQKTLNENELYKDWQDSPLYFDKNTNLYNLYIKKDSTIVVYGLNKQGKAVTYNSYTVQDE